MVNKNKKVIKEASRFKYEKSGENAFNRFEKLIDEIEALGLVDITTPKQEKNGTFAFESKDKKHYYVVRNPALRGHEHTRFKGFNAEPIKTGKNISVRHGMGILGFGNARRDPPSEKRLETYEEAFAWIIYNYKQYAPKPKEQKKVNWSGMEKEQSMYESKNNSLKNLLSEGTETKIDLNQPFGVFRKGGSIGEGRSGYVMGYGAETALLLQTFDTAEEAKEDAKRANSHLTRGEKQYYGLKYSARKIDKNKLRRNTIDESKSTKLSSLLNEIDLSQAAPNSFTGWFHNNREIVDQEFAKPTYTPQAMTQFLNTQFDTNKLSISPQKRQEIATNLQKYGNNKASAMKYIYDMYLAGSDLGVNGPTSPLKKNKPTM